MACRIPILRFEQHSSAEATIGLVFPFAQFFSFLILTSSSRTCSGIQRVSHIVFPLLSSFQLIRHRLLRFSSIQRSSALNRRFKFRSVIRNRCHRISYGMLQWDKYEFTRLAHWLDNWPNVLLLQQNPTCYGRTNLHLVASILFRIKLRLPSNQTSVASCSLRLAVLVVLVFIIESGRTFESLNPGVLPCRHPTNTQSHPALSFSHLDLYCRMMPRSVCFFESFLTLDRCGSHNQAAQCVKHLEFHTCSCQVDCVSDNILRKSDVNEFLHCSLDALLMSQCFNFSDKLDRTETSTLLVESTDSSLYIGTISQTLSDCTQSLPVPQSHATTLIPASSISSVSSSAWGLVMPRAFARVWARSQHQIFKQISIVNLYSFFQDWFPLKRVFCY